MLLATNQDYMEVANQLIYLVGQVYGILVFLLACFTVWLVYKLFNSFF